MVGLLKEGDIVVVHSVHNDAYFVTKVFKVTEKRCGCIIRYNTTTFKDGQRIDARKITKLGVKYFPFGNISSVNGCCVEED